MRRNHISLEASPSQLASGVRKPKRWVLARTIGQQWYQGTTLRLSPIARSAGVHGRSLTWISSAAAAYGQAIASKYDPA